MVEAETGTPVVVRQEPGLHGKASGAYVASDPDPSRHLIVYDPAQSRYLNHIIPHELGHLKQHVAAAPEQRMVATMSAAHRARARERLFMRLPLATLRAFPADVLDEVADLWSGGLVTQLASFPADIRIERAIWVEHPPLRAIQREALELQARAAHEALDARVAAVTPGFVFEGTNAMNYALLKSVARMLQQPWMVRPYRGSIHERAGEDLLDLFNATAPHDLPTCLEVSNAWAERLGVADWYLFVPARASNPNARRLWQ